MITFLILCALATAVPEVVEVYQAVETVKDISK